MGFSGTRVTTKATGGDEITRENGRKRTDGSATACLRERGEKEGQGRKTEEGSGQKRQGCAELKLKEGCISRTERRSTVSHAGALAKD